LAPSATEELIVTVDPAAPTAEQPVATEAPTVEAATAEPTVEAVVTEEALAPTVEAVATEDVAATAEPVVTDAPTVEAVATEVPAVPTAEPTAEQPVATSEPVATEPTEGAPVFLSEIEYVVQDGDNLYSIALVYGSTIEAIAEASGIERETVLFPGDVLTVPIPVPVAVGEPEPLMTDVPTATPEPTAEPTAEATPEATEAAPSGEQTYVVRSGDTLIAIARSFGVNEFELAAFNGFTVVDVIRVGQVLRIPPAEPVEAEEGTGGSGEAEATPEPTPTFRRYVILPGDTLSRIAARYGTSVRALIELNNITNPNRILYGQVIRIPNE
jgi:LysM repeat protein